MNKKKFVLALLTLVFVFSLNAQNDLGRDYFYLNNYELAARYFEANPPKAQAELKYYLGEIAFANGKMEEARTLFNEGVALNEAYPYNKIGLAKLDLKTKQGEALASFIAIQRRNNEADVIIAIGYAYLDNGMFEQAVQKVAEARKADRKNPMAYILEGDIHKANRNLGEAAGSYDQAIYLDPSFALSYIKSAVIYENSPNWQAPIDKLKTVLELYPGYIIPYGYMGKIYSNKAIYSLSIESFQTYFKNGMYTLSDIMSYATALYFNKQYDEALVIIKEGLAIAPNNFVLNRLQMYSAANMQDVENGLKYSQKFFSLKRDTSDKYIEMDYTMNATLLKDAKRYDEAMVEYQKALDLDPNAYAIYKDMANLAKQVRNNGLAGDLYQKFIDAAGEQAEALDYYQVGNYYYTAGRSSMDVATMRDLQADDNFMKRLSDNPQMRDSLKTNDSLFTRAVIEFYAVLADTAFGTVIAMIPDGYTGYFWRARTSSLLDPSSENGLAKPYYEKSIELLADKDMTNRTLKSYVLESYTYLGYFYYLKDDNENTILYLNNALELDPENNTAKTILDTIKK